MPRREAVRNKLSRMIAGQVKSYINDHPSHVHPAAIQSLPGSIAKRVAGELWSKGFEFKNIKKDN